VDANGNVYVLGDSTGSFGSEVNQGTQDVYLTKYDSAGNLQWTKLLGAAGTASGFGLAVDPKSGGVVISGSVTGDLTPTAIGSGTDSFVAKYDAAGNQLWLRQVAPATTDQANSVSVDSSGNVYVGGQVNGGIGSGQISAGGTDAYVTKLDSAGKLVYQRQFGTTGTDAAARTAVAADGNLLVASVQNGHAILTKYSAADNTTPALWQIDLGDLQGGSIGGLAVANGQVYVSGTTANASQFGGTTAFSSGGDAAHLTVTDVNHAPVLDASKSPTFGSIPENAGAPVGAMGINVSSLVDLNPPAGGLDNVTDADSGTQIGVAIVGIDTVDGTLWYSADSGTHWVTYSSASDSAAILIPAPTLPIPATSWVSVRSARLLSGWVAVGSPVPR